MNELLSVQNSLKTEQDIHNFLLSKFKEDRTDLHMSRLVEQKIAFFISFHSGQFYSAPSSPLLLRGAPDYSTDTVSEFHAEAHRQLQVKDLPKVPTWRHERESNPRPSG